MTSNRTYSEHKCTKLHYHCCYNFEFSEPSVLFEKTKAIKSCCEEISKMAKDMIAGNESRFQVCCIIVLAY